MYKISTWYLSGSCINSR